MGDVEKMPLFYLFLLSGIGSFFLSRFKSYSRVFGELSEPTALKKRSKSIFFPLVLRLIGCESPVWKWRKSVFFSSGITRLNESCSCSTLTSWGVRNKSDLVTCMPPKLFKILATPMGCDWGVVWGESFRDYAPLLSEEKKSFCQGLNVKFTFLLLSSQVSSVPFCERVTSYCPLHNPQLGRITTSGRL